MVVEVHSGVGNNHQSRTGQLLSRLTDVVLINRLGEDPWCVEVVHSCLEETGSQSQTHDFLGLQLQLVLGLTHPGERAVDLQGLRTAKQKAQTTLAFAGSRMVSLRGLVLVEYAETN